MLNTRLTTVRVADSERLEEGLPRLAGNGSNGASGSSPRIRVLHCIGGLGGGGAERQLSYLSAELIRRGIDVHIAYRHGGTHLSSIQESGAVLHELEGQSNYDPLLLWQLIKLVRSIKPDLIQTWLLQMDVLAGIAAVLTRTPFLMTERSSAPAYNWSWKGRLRSWIGRRAAVIIANSVSGRAYWLSKKSPELIKVIRNGVPVEAIQRTAPICLETQGLEEPREILLFAGRYSPEKNLSVLVDAIFLVLAERTNAVALFFGEGPLKSKLIAEVKRRGMADRMKIFPYTTQLWSWMKRANVFLSVSLFEGSPNTILEAAVQGCPLILSDIPQHRELLSEDTSFFVSPGSPDDIAHGILKALRDPESAKRKAQSACQKVSPLTVDSVANEYLGVYRLALARLGLAEGPVEKCVGEALRSDLQ